MCFLIYPPFAVIFLVSLSVIHQLVGTVLPTIPTVLVPQTTSVYANKDIPSTTIKNVKVNTPETNQIHKLSKLLRTSNFVSDTDECSVGTSSILKSKNTNL